MDNKTKYNYQRQRGLDTTRYTHGSNLPQVNCPNAYAASVTRHSYVSASGAVATNAYRNYGRPDTKNKSFFRSFAFVACAAIVAIILFFTILVVSFRGGSTTTFDFGLSAPQNLIMTNQTLTWDSVPNATGYAIYINGRRVTVVDGTSVEVGSFLSGASSFEVSVRAIGAEDVADSAPATLRR